MRLSRMYRLIAVCAVALVAAGGVLISAGAAWAGPHHAGAGHRAGTGHHDPEGLLASSDGQAQLRIPTPACPPDKASCTWVLFVNEPKVPGRTVIGEVSGTSGTLVVDLPSFCGVVQADAALGPRPWHSQGGIRVVEDDCGSGESSTTTTTTTTATTTTTTLRPRPPGTRSGGGAQPARAEVPPVRRRLVPDLGVAFYRRHQAAHPATSVPVRWMPPPICPLPAPTCHRWCSSGSPWFCWVGSSLPRWSRGVACYTGRRPFVPIR